MMFLAHRTAGHDPDRAPVLLIHGGAEDATMLTPEAQAIAAQGRRVAWYDRRGTGASTRDDWPGSGADQHADDAAALPGHLDAGPAVVLGFSSGGVVVLAWPPGTPRQWPRRSPGSHPPFRSCPTAWPPTRR
jgi:pimeloyl-ACP methyl ester carboxylesterase